jgi:hypothetical protein
MFSFHSNQVQYSEANGVGEGQRNVVRIDGEKGYKEHAKIGPNGKTRQRKRHSLTAKEIASIKKRKFIKGLFRCCRETRKTRKADRVQRKKMN